MLVVIGTLTLAHLMETNQVKKVLQKKINVISIKRDQQVKM